MHLILFIVFAGFCLAGAINLLLQSHPINSALSLIVVMTSLAVLYLLLGAEFLAAAQVIVYAGAIMVLFTFVVMLLNAGREERTLGSRAARGVGLSRGCRHPGRACHRDSACAGPGRSQAERRHHLHGRSERGALHQAAAALRGHLSADSHRDSGRGCPGPSRQTESKQKGRAANEFLFSRRKFRSPGICS